VSLGVGAVPLESELQIRQCGLEVAFEHMTGRTLTDEVG
jgi:hypothetical protein